MTCRDCGSKKHPSSPIDGICVVCATRKWRICQTKLTEFRRDPEHDIDDPAGKLEDFLDGIPSKHDQELSEIGFDISEDRLVSNYDWENEPHRISSKKMRRKGIKGIKNISKEEIPSEVLDSLYLMNYKIWESQRRGSSTFFFEKKDTALVEGCEIFFSPDFMYQLHCEECWGTLEKRSSERTQKSRDRKKTHERDCAVCGSDFTTERPSHYLCRDCQHDWLSCSGDCDSYFRPYKQRFSESYCPECRKNIPPTNADLLTRVVQKLDVEVHFNNERKFRS